MKTQFLIQFTEDCFPSLVIRINATLEEQADFEIQQINYFNMKEEESGRPTAIVLFRYRS